MPSINTRTQTPPADIDKVRLQINTVPGMKIPGKPYKADKNPKGEGHYDIYFNPDIYKDYTEGGQITRDRDFDPKKDERFESLSKEEGKTRPKDIQKGEIEAASILISRTRRPCVKSEKA